MKMPNAYKVFAQDNSIPDAYQAFQVSPQMPSAYQEFTPSDPWEAFKQIASSIAEANNFPSNVLLGQAAEESARGTSHFAKERNNFFGMNAVDSDPEKATTYQTPEDSIKDYINLIENSPRYSQYYQNYLVDHDPFKLIQGIKAAGYASDPNYVQAVTSTPEFQEGLQ